MNQSFCFAGIKIDNLGLQEAMVHIEKMLKGKKSHYIFTPNATHIFLFQKDEEFRKIYKKASLVLPDGMPLVWVSRLIKPRLKERISGTDFVFSLCDEANQKGYTIFLLGAEPTVIRKARAALNQKFSGLQIVGIHDGYFNDDTEVINKINASRPDILFVGIGFPKQEKWIGKNINRLHVKVVVSIGGAFDVIGGKFKRAPLLMRKWGLEWLWRLSQEPRRLWKRYLIGNTTFFWLVLKELLKKI
jgi:N-acetylglucosaminyldiphosphoundecaprenol N-acetyl-beta-D-mannosaminyltransferase